MERRPSDQVGDDLDDAVVRHAPLPLAGQAARLDVLVLPRLNDGSLLAGAADPPCLRLAGSPNQPVESEPELLFFGNRGSTRNSKML